MSFFISFHRSQIHAIRERGSNLISRDIVKSSLPGCCVTLQKADGEQNFNQNQTGCGISQ